MGLLEDEGAGNDLKFAGVLAPVGANDTQVAGDHYKKLAIQPWDYIGANNLPWFEGEIIKYVTRWRDKNGVEDLRKARHILDKMIETTEQEIKTAAMHGAAQVALAQLGVDVMVGMRTAAQQDRVSPKVFEGNINVFSDKPPGVY